MFCLSQKKLAYLRSRKHFRRRAISQLWWLMTRALALGSLRQEDCHNFQASLGHRARPYHKRKKRRNTVFSLTQAFLGTVSQSYTWGGGGDWDIDVENKNPLGSGSECLFMTWTWSRRRHFLKRDCVFQRLFSVGRGESGTVDVSCVWGQAILDSNLDSNTSTVLLSFLLTVFGGRTGALSAHPHGYFTNYIRFMEGNHYNWLTP